MMVLDAAAAPEDILDLIQFYQARRMDDQRASLILPELNIVDGQAADCSQQKSGGM
jgi:hypothetical protein